MAGRRRRAGQMRARVVAKSAPRNYGCSWNRYTPNIFANQRFLRAAFGRYPCSYAHTRVRVAMVRYDAL